MGSVWAGQPIEQKVPVAIKVINTDSIFGDSARAGVVLDGVWAPNGAEVSRDSVQANQALTLNRTTLGAD